MHPSFPALLELEIARREAELHHDRVSAPRSGIVGRSICARWTRLRVWRPPG